MNEIIVRRDGSEIGRYTRPNLIRFIRLGRICASDQLSNDGGVTWQTVGTSSFASYVTVESAPKSSAEFSTRQGIQRPQNDSPNPAAGTEAASPGPDWTPFLQVFSSVGRFCRSAVGIVLLGGLLFIGVVVGGIVLWKSLAPDSPAARSINVWLAQYNETADLFADFESAAKKCKPEEEKALVTTYAEKFQIQAQLLNSLAADVYERGPQQDMENYAVALNGVAQCLDEIVRMQARKSDQDSNAIANVLIGTLLSIGADDPAPFFSAVGSSLSEASALSGAGKELQESMMKANRNLKAADAVIRVKYAGR